MVVRVARRETDVIVDRARAVAADVAALADHAEAARRCPPPLLELLVATGVPHAGIPARFGGGEADAWSLLCAIEELGAADASAGWVAMIAATSGLMAGFIDPDEASGMSLDDPAVVAAGVSAPKGKAVRVDGGYRVSGRWSFASGCQHATWIGLGSLVVEGTKVARLASGGPDVRMMVVRAADVEVHDTWDTSGLRGTGSHDVSASDVFVPEGRQFSLLAPEPRCDGPLYRFPLLGLLAIGVAAVACGVARAAIDDLVELAGAKRPEGSRRTLAERPAAQADVARAEALRASARAYLEDVVGAAWEAASAGDIGTGHRVALRLAATNAARSCARAVDLMYEAGGGSSIHASNPLQRRFRDVHALTQHMMVSPSTYELAGRLLLDVDTDTSQL